ncbi:MAG: dTDP-glucose 4,6-dehydratase [Candidatus Daviesbacteria bacterium GW2011_GWA2_38_24]|uniref:dTDP-glucose 4,6-dehydratase n=1 Tax=Candidatus Daviesbacteria bacterium GW2011_GWA2_38_24 TaxID=1618422 RepID=A0A0G0JHX5_9BACT|nr:MAG: dTDP-glucose 4,6-dehydratase [Candidatus Daviesbacteria bacterium GW2011_GWA2_38_24]KKQ79639.1 MAG: dTDP-glucose 4,6-dehydratase [Candidatus Daviesbacteria bacterium GW2011_GWA1_38_7]OGE23007.1 MAG: dTDP-glucose 4,6-dehydratase [Candidatus Daviesbacteria bacterium RIFCSPHIGHO2_01_FULL_38_8]
MKLLVTGGAGFIGSNFIGYYLKNHPEDQIINLDSLTYAGNLESLKDVAENPHYSFIQGDITNPEDVKEAMTGVDFVVHFAAESHVDRSLLDPLVFVKTNVLGTGVLLNEALNQNIKRFHHVSTDEVFGSLELDDSHQFNEQTPYDPRSPYSASKAGSDHLVRSYYKSFGLPITITNCSNNFGPYHFPEKFIPLAITNLLEDKKVPVYGDGKNVRDWLYVEDHARAIDLVIHKGEVGDTYLMGGMTDDISNIEVVKKIIKLLGKTEDSIEFVEDRKGHDRRYATDWSKIKTKLGWEPIFDFDTRLEETVNWFKQNEWWWKKLKLKVKNR